jgi:hypothetical protein
VLTARMLPTRLRSLLQGVRAPPPMAMSMPPAMGGRGMSPTVSPRMMNVEPPVLAIASLASDMQCTWQRWRFIRAAQSARHHFTCAIYLLHMHMSVWREEGGVAM